jgi:hypothetical protein
MIVNLFIQRTSNRSTYTELEAKGGFYEGYGDRTFGKSFCPDITDFADFGRSCSEGNSVGHAQQPRRLVGT